MLYVYCNKVLDTLSGIVLLFSSIAYAGTSENLHSINDDIVVGLLKIEEKTYPHEDSLSKNICEMFNNWGVKTILIDYNEMISLKKIKEESFYLAKQDEILARKLTLDRIKVGLAKFINEFKINRIFIPGNYSDLQSEPLVSTSCPQLVTEAIVEIVDDNPTVHLFGICKALQGIIDLKEIKVVSSDEEKQESNSKSSPNPQRESVPLQQIKIVPNSRLAKVVAKFLLPDENGWFSTYFPDAHSVTVSNTVENRKKLESLGYKIVAFSSDGVIEAVEDRHGNIYFRSHPEILVVKPDKSLYSSNHKARQVSTLVAMAIINDFLYRA